MRERKPVRVLHVLNLSLPVISGYSIRSRGLIHGQQHSGIVPAVVTGPLHELQDGNSSETLIDCTPHLRTHLPGNLLGRAVRQRWPIIRELGVVYLLERRIKEILRPAQFDILHAHSPVLCGLAGLLAARALGSPFVYEIRAFWEDAAVDQQKITTNSLQYHCTRWLENYVTLHADAVVGIASRILDDLRSRGVKRDKLFHVPNGVDTAQSRFGTF